MKKHLGCWCNLDGIPLKLNGFWLTTAGDASKATLSCVTSIGLSLRSHLILPYMSPYSPTISPPEPLVRTSITKCKQCSTELILVPNQCSEPPISASFSSFRRSRLFRSSFCCSSIVLFASSALSRMSFCASKTLVKNFCFSALSASVSDLYHSPRELTRSTPLFSRPRNSSAFRTASWHVCVLCSATKQTVQMSFQQLEQYRVARSFGCCGHISTWFFTRSSILNALSAPILSTLCELVVFSRLWMLLQVAQRCCSQSWQYTVAAGELPSFSRHAPQTAPPLEVTF